MGVGSINLNLQIKNFKNHLFFKELIPFLIVQIWVIFTVKNILYRSQLLEESITPPRLTLSDLWILLFVVVLFVIIVKYSGRARNIIFRIFFALAIYTGSQLALSLFFSQGLAALVAIALVIGLFIFQRVILHNIAIVATLAGIGAVLGASVDPFIALIILAALSFYDIWAVYKTKHMIVLAESMISAGAISGLVLPMESKDFFSSTRNIAPGPKSMILGSGDVVFPLLLSGAVASYSLSSALIISLFAAIGLWLTHILFVNQAERRPMAALPPIATMTILGYLITLLI